MAKTSTKAVLLSLILMTVAIISLPRLVKAESSSIHVTINKPQSGETCYIGDKVEIRVTPQIVVYGVTNYVQVEVVKDNKILKHENLIYTSLNAVSTSFTPDSSGSYTIKAGFSSTGGSSITYENPQTVTVKVVDPATEIKTVKPKTTQAHRFSRDISVLYFDNYSGYNVNIYRSTKKTSGFKRINTVSNKDYYQDEGLKNTTYYYKIRLAKKIGSKTYYSEYSKVAVSKPEGIPTIKSVKYIKGKGVKITWTASPYADMYFFIRIGDDEFFKELPKTQTYYLDKKVKAGKTYEYEVKAYNEKDGNGKASQIVKIKIPK